MAEVRAKKALGQHFLTDQKIARDIVDALHPLSRRTRASADALPGRDFCEGKSWKGEKAAGGSGEPCSPVLEVGPGMGVLTQYLLQREDIDLKLVEIDSESVEYLLTHFPGMEGRLMEADFLTLPLYIVHLRGVWTRKDRALDPMLPLLVMSTFLLSLLLLRRQ